MTARRGSSLSCCRVAKPSKERSLQRFALSKTQPRLTNSPFVAVRYSLLTVICDMNKRSNGRRLTVGMLKIANRSSLRRSVKTVLILILTIGKVVRRPKNRQCKLQSLNYWPDNKTAFGSVFSRPTFEPFSHLVWDSRSVAAANSQALATASCCK